MASIVTYDVSAKHIEVKKALLQLGYVDKIIDTQTQRPIYLPNTTFYHTNKDSKSAREDVQKLSAVLGIELERCVATQWGPDWAALFGKPFL